MAGTVLVTGGTGYIAGEVIDQLLGRGWAIQSRQCRAYSMPVPRWAITKTI